ncbi:tRNA-guanine(15) transglycosylase-like protein [Lyophyllum atratum]|nr:tRNA-guanine(15) transglycosylase-like protein [Lyophyllum atratum]
MAHSQRSPGLQFTLAGTAQPCFGPRLGMLVLRRSNGIEIKLETPALLTSTSRGVVPHLSRDHARLTNAIGWVHVPFETFLEHSPPVPTMQPGPHALHRFLGFVPADHLLSMSVRDPADVREMPANGTSHVSAYSLRGVRKISPADWRSYTAACQPDIVVAMTDTPYTTPPFSQKRLTKSIDRSSAWLASLFAPPPPTAPSTTVSAPVEPDTNAPQTQDRDRNRTSPAVFVHLAGSASHPARAAFAASLRETLHGTERTAVGGLASLDEGVAGYTADLAPLRLAAAASSVSSDVAADTPPKDDLPSLLRTSLSTLPHTKPRLVNGTRGPHEVLRLIRDVGIDVLDARWAMEAAGWGVALDFVFPVPEGGEGGKKELGRNLYDSVYALDFAGLSDVEGCVCAACAPAVPETRIVHGTDPSEAGDARNDGMGQGQGPGEKKEGYKRAYVHHLLRTHEMSAHALLVMHNLAVVDAFLAGVRKVLLASGAGDSPGHVEERFGEEVRRFGEVYSEEGGVMEEARVMWREVEMARGKGRLAREREKQGQTEEGAGAEEGM